MFTMSLLMLLCGFIGLSLSDINTQKCDINNIHECMTEDELIQVFGKSRQVPHYEVGKLKIGNRVRKRSTGREEMDVTIQLDGSELQLQLESQLQLLSPSFKVVSRVKDEEINLSPQVDCLFTGKVANEQNSVVAVSQCGDNKALTGYVFINESDFLVQPLPPRIAKMLQQQGEENNLEIVYEIKDKQGTCVTHNKEWMEEAKVDIRPLKELQTNIGNNNEIEKNMSRRKREVNTDKNVIELAIFVDYAMYELYNKIFEDYTDKHITDVVLTMMYGANVLFESPSLQSNVSLVLLKLEILKKDMGPNPEKGEVVKYLQNFCKWQSSLNTLDDSDPEHWDHAILLSGIDLYDYLPKWKSVAGLAWVGGMCDISRSCSVSEGLSFGAAYTIAHEVGHSFGMVHDGTDNKCTGSKNIMAVTMGPGRKGWSPCSDKELAQFLSKHQASCLLDSPTNNYIMSRSRGSGAHFSADFQCRIKYDKEWSAHIDPRDDRYKNICNALYCKNSTHYQYANAALEGTPCNGSNWVCKDGKCEKSTDSPILLLPTTPEPNSTEEEIIVQRGVIGRLSDEVYELYDEVMETVHNITNDHLFGIDMSEDGLFQSFAQYIFPFLGLLPPDTFLLGRSEKMKSNETGM